MIGLLLYVILAASALAAPFLGPYPLLGIAIFCMPLMQTLPFPLGTISVPINLVLLGLIIASRKKPPSTADTWRLPARGPLLFFVGTSLIALATRWYGELQGEIYWVPMLEVVKTSWGALTGFALYALAFRQLRGATRTVRIWMITLCQLSLASEGLLSAIERVRGVGRATAHLDEANKAGAFFASGAVFFLVFALFEHTRRRWAYLAALCCCLAGLFNSLSRGGMLAAVVASALVLAVFFTATRGRTGTKVAVIVVAVLLTVNAGLFLPQRVIDRVSETFGGETRVGDEDVNIDGSSAERLIFWKAGWELFKERPLGYGTTTFPQLQEAKTGYGKASHNIYVLILVEQGAQGIVAFVLFAFAVMAYLWRTFSRNDDGEIRCLALALMGWWTAHLLAHIFINSFFFPQMTGQFWLLLACLGGAVSVGTKPSATRKRKMASAASA